MMPVSSSDRLRMQYAFDLIARARMMILSISSKDSVVTALGEEFDRDILIGPHRIPLDEWECGGLDAVPGTDGE
jgi:hypothetical protein